MTMMGQQKHIKHNKTKSTKHENALNNKEAHQNKKQTFKLTIKQKQPQQQMNQESYDSDHMAVARLHVT